MLAPFRLSPLVALVLLGGCSMGPSDDVALGPTLAQPNPAFATADQGAALTPASVAPVTAAQGPATGVSIADLGTYIDPAALSQLSSGDRQEAASAQFNALTFGRPAAPRSWEGASGAKGQVIVGPYVQVNSIDCRDFTSTVTIGGKDYTKTGTACRNPDGGWSVVG
jgi:surface antigen